MAKLVSKMALAATLAQSSDGHNLVTLCPIWTNDHTKMIYSSRRIDWCKELSSISIGLDFDIFGHLLPPGGHLSHFGQTRPKPPSEGRYWTCL